MKNVSSGGQYLVFLHRELKKQFSGSSQKSNICTTKTSGNYLGDTVYNKKIVGFSMEVISFSFN